MRLRIGLISLLLVLSSTIFFSSDDIVVSGIPTLEDGSYMEFSYEKQTPDGEYSKDGVRTATVTYSSWTGTDCLLFSGTDVGTFTSNDYSGSFSGEYKSYFNYDLALMYTWSEITTEIDGISITETNESGTSYGFPYHRWIALPLSPPDSWNSNVSETITWDLYYSDGSDESGNDIGIMDWSFLCFSPDTQDVTVEAGTYATLKIIGNRQNDDPLDRSTETWYSEDLGWWVERNVWADDGPERVLIEHYELTDVSTNSAPEIESTPSVSMDEDTIEEIDYDDVFSDPDGDTLTYQVSGNGTLPVTLESQNVRIAPLDNEHGDWSFSLSATDPKGATASVVIDVTVDPVDDLPVLSNNGVTPEIGVETTEFTFQVDMMDIDGYSSSDLFLHVDSVEYAHDVDPGDATDGVTLSWEMTLPIGSHEYYFMIDGTREPVSGVFTGPEVGSSHTPHLGALLLNMDEGGSSDEIEYGTIWTYGGGELPDTCKVYIDGSLHDMEKGFGSPETGVEYRFQTLLSEGEHTYYFEARLGLDTYRYPVSGVLEGPVIHDPKIVQNGYAPVDLVDGDEATFFAVFQYGHEEDPTAHMVVIDDIQYELTPTSGELVSGVNYTVKRKLSEGSHTYSFMFVVESETLTTSTWSFSVEPVEGDDEPPGPTVTTPSENEGVNPVLIAVIVILVVLACVGIYIFFIKKKDEEWGDDTEDDDYDQVELRFKP